MECRNDSIWKRAKLLAEFSDKDDLQGITLLILYDVGVPLSCSGFDYLKYGIPIAAKRPARVVVNEIISCIQDSYEVEIGYTAIDSAIREAIKKAWEDRENNKWEYYFPDYMLRRDKPPSNAEFIAAIAYFLEMWQGCCKEGDYAGK